MNIAEKISGVCLVLMAAGITIGIPMFATIRDAKALRSELSTAPICGPDESLCECLPPLPPLPVEEVSEIVV